MNFAEVFGKPVHRAVQDFHRDGARYRVWDLVGHLRMDTALYVIWNAFDSDTGTYAHEFR